MSDEVGDIVSYYNREVEGEDNRLECHQLERDMTWRYFDMYLRAGSRVLEIGAATGTHTLWLASHGHRVIAIDFAQTLLERCREKLSIAGLQERVDCRLDDARDLHQVPESEFDAVLLMGPLYHLFSHEDRLCALKQAVQRLKTDGVFFSSHISRFGILGDLMCNIPQWIEKRDEVWSIIEHGRDPVDYPKGQFRGYFARVDEIIAWHEEAGLQTLALAGVEPAISADDDSYNRLQEPLRGLWLDLLFKVGQEPGMLAASRHLLYVGTK
jgi:S-adenosylmethionine-dependent methyltransferase